MSLGMSFARRRMMAAAKKEPKYVWAVYDFAYVRDDASVITGTFTYNDSTTTKATSSTYTVNASGFTLTNPTDSMCSRLKSGTYIVDITQTATSKASGEYLYEVTSNNTNTRTLKYNRYGVKRSKGDTELYRVESDTLDYPVDGEQNGLWYVMIKGEVETYVWNVFEIAEITTYNAKARDSSNRTISPSKNQTFSVGNFNSQTGTFDLTTTIKLTAPDSQLSGKYYNASGTTGAQSSAQYGVSSLKTTSTGFSWGFKWYDSVATTTSGKGDSTGTTQESSDRNAYPQDGIQGDYWYTYSHSYMNEFDNR